MDSSRFDAIVRRFAGRRVSRRAALTTSGGGLAALLGAVSGRRVATQAQTQSGRCTHRGCRCRGGTQNACNSGLVCCPDNPGVPGGPGRCMRERRCNLQDCKGEGCPCHTGVRGACEPGLVCCSDDSSVPGGPGRCEAHDVCYEHQCQATTNPCPDTCNWGDYCPGCCSGHCGDLGACAAPPCDGIGCECVGGTAGACDPGLVCCPYNPGLPGGHGQCAAPDACGAGGIGAEAP